ncbi:unnamed protein product [Schistosoma turkestanicum]|nr:unnamed protein product [Schistosoma turkestanicum]
MKMDWPAMENKMDSHDECDYEEKFTRFPRVRAISTYKVKEDLENYSRSVCEELAFCEYYYINDFVCVNSVEQLRAMYYVEYTFILDNFRKYTIDGRSNKLEASELFKEINDSHEKPHNLTNTILIIIAFHLQFKRKFNDKLSDMKEDLTTMFNTALHSHSVELTITPYYQSTHYCMGPSGNLVPQSSECDLCSPGSYYPSHIINPPPPSIDEELFPYTEKQPVFMNRYLRSSYYSQFDSSDNHRTKCLPCPKNTYSEEFGQTSCLPCPFQHSMPIDADSDKQPINASDWLHRVCPKEGVAEMIKLQIIEKIFGKTIREYIKKTTLINQAKFLNVIIALPAIITFLLLFIAYVLIDVGSTFKEIAKTLHPLQVQLAEISTANARSDVEESQAAEKIYKRMKKV